MNIKIGAEMANPKVYSPTRAGVPSFDSAEIIPHCVTAKIALPVATHKKLIRKEGNLVYTPFCIVRVNSHGSSLNEHPVD